MNEVIQNVAVFALPVLFAITLHEAAHAYVARYFGDSTAYMQGRMSLNPAKHIDPFGTILLPILMYVATGGAFFLGYAKPVPVNWGNLRNPKRDMAWVAAAGPVANLIMALLWLIMAMLLTAAKVGEPYFMEVATAGVAFNLVIFAFNLFPIPPLDGGRIVFSFLPKHAAYNFARIEPYGFFIVLGLAALNLLHYWVVPLQTAGGFVISLLVSPLTFLLS